MNRPLRFALLALLVSCTKTTPPPTPEPSTEPDPAPPAMSTEFNDEASDVAVTSAGDVMVVGLTEGGSYDGDLEPIDFWFMRRYSVEGKLKWQQRVDRCKNPPFVAGSVEPGSIGYCEDVSVSVASDNADNAYVLSQTRASYNYGDDVTLSYLSKYTADGTRLWDHRVAEFRSGDQGQTGRLVTDFAVGTDGSAYLIAPGAVKTMNRQNATLLKYGADGLKLWEKAGGFPDTDTVVVSGQSIYTAGVTDNVTDKDTDNAMTELHKLTTDGDPLWARTMPNPGYDEFVSLAVSGEAHVYVVTGVADTTRIYYDGSATITKFSGEGALLWTETLTPEPYWGVGEVAADAQGRLYLVGTAEMVGENGVESSFGYVLRYSPEGARDWLAPLQGAEQRGVLDTTAKPLGVVTTPTRDSYGNPQTRLYIAGVAEKRNSPWPDDAFLLSANDRSDEPDIEDAYPDSLEAFWINH